MKTSLRRVISASAISMILAGTLATPASAATIERDFTVTGPVPESAANSTSNFTRLDHRKHLDMKTCLLAEIAQPPLTSVPITLT